MEAAGSRRLPHAAGALGIIQMLSYERIVALVFAVGLFAAGAFAANAQNYEAALSGFAKDSFNDTDKAIGEVAASGNPLALEVIRALQEGRLQYGGGRVLYKDGTGALLDATTGKPAADVPSDLKTARLNNRLRRTIEAALGGLTLMSPDPNRRYEAAQAAFKSRDAAPLVNLDAALAKETAPRVKRVLGEARAAVILNQADAKENDKLNAIATIRERADQDSRGLLSALPSGQTPLVQKAAADAIASIDNRLLLWSAVQNAWYGLSLGSVLLLAAIGLAITFGVMGVINMAHGEMVMLGAYTTYVVQDLIRTHNPALFGYSLLIALPLAFLFAGFVGILIERGVVRFLYGRPLAALLATWGLSLIIQQAVRTAFGPTNKDVGNPSWMSGSFDLGHITITYNRLWIIVFTLLIFVGLLGLLRYTRFGLETRAVTQNRAMAPSMGIKTSRIDALTFGLGSGIAGLAGVALSQIDSEPQSRPGLHHR